MYFSGESNCSENINGLWDQFNYYAGDLLFSETLKTPTRLRVKLGTRVDTRVRGNRGNCTPVYKKVFKS